jgi:chromosomal replication initiator protein
MSVRSPQEIWEAALGELQLQVTKANYETWLKESVGISYQGGQFVIGTPKVFAAEWLEKRLCSLIKKTLIGIIGEEVEVQFQVYQKETTLKVLPSSPRTFPRKTKIEMPLRSKLNHKYTFDTFIVGSCNRLAHAAALRVAERPGQSYNPLFIYGGVGLGKTHLLHAIGHAALNSGFQPLYTSTEQFTNEFINAIKEGKTEDFRSKYRNVDLLLIDDIHFISGKEQTQESFFHTFNDLHNANRQIVITSDHPPRAVPLLEERLRSRFEWGLIADVQPPDFETRLAILRAKAEQQGANIADDIVMFIARRYQRNIRELEGSLNRVTAYAKLIKEPLTLDLAQQALRDIADSMPIYTPPPTTILNTVCNYFNLRLEVLKGGSREQPVALARQIVMYLAREGSRCSLNEIGELLGGRDHSTILHGCQRIAAEIDANPKLRSDVFAIKQRLYAREGIEAH